MTGWITALVDALGYPGIVLVMFLENVFPPLPSELIMPLAGFSASRGTLRLPGVILAGTLGSVLGALDQMEFRQAWQHTKELVACLRVNGFDIPERRQLEERIEADSQRDESK